MDVLYPVAYAESGAVMQHALADVRSDWTLNWGYSGTFTGNTDLIINPPAVVKFNSDKATSKYAMEVAGVPTPHVMTPAMAELEMEERPRTMVGRRRRTSQGRHLHVAATINVVKAGNLLTPRPVTHWCDWIDADQEFRVHVIADRVVKISQKLGGEGDIRSHRNGWRFLQPEIPSAERRKMRQAAKDAVTAIGLDFGAVDVLRDSSTGEVWVLEVNTAPAMTDPTSNTLDRYVRHITQNWGIDG